MPGPLVRRDRAVAPAPRLRACVLATASAGLAQVAHLAGGGGAAGASALVLLAVVPLPALAAVLRREARLPLLLALMTGLQAAAHAALTLLTPMPPVPAAHVHLAGPPAMASAPSPGWLLAGHAAVALLVVAALRDGEAAVCGAARLRRATAARLGPAAAALAALLRLPAGPVPPPPVPGAGTRPSPADALRRATAVLLTDVLARRGPPLRVV